MTDMPLTELGLLRDGNWHEYDAATQTYRMREYPEGPILLEETYPTEADCIAAVDARFNAEDANAETLRSRAASALQANRDFLAIATPTNAQVLTQVKALTRQMNGLARLVIGELDGTD